MYRFSRWDIRNSGVPIGDPFAFGKYQDPVTATVAGGAALAGGLLQADAAKSAAGQQANTANNATQTQLQMFNTINNQNAPYRQAGYNALGQISAGMGTTGGTDGSGPLTQDQVQKIYQQYMGRPVLPEEMASLMATNSTASQLEKSVAGSSEASQHLNVQRNVAPVTSPLFTDGAQPSSSGGIGQGQFTHQFDANDLQTNLAPNYQFQLDQGMGAARNAGNLQSGLISGNTLKGINDYAQNFAGNAYQNAFNNYNTNQSNIFNRLSTIAGFGSGANQTTANAGTTTAGNVGNAQMATGAAQAAGTVGSANALSGGVQNAASWYALPSILKMGSSGAGAE